MRRVPVAGHQGSHHFEAGLSKAAIITSSLGMTGRLLRPKRPVLLEQAIQITFNTEKSVQFMIAGWKYKSLNLVFHRPVSHREAPAFHLNFHFFLVISLP